jgi:hypothetical protein
MAKPTDPDERVMNWVCGIILVGALVLGAFLNR